MTRLKVKEDLNDKKEERVKRMDGWMDEWIRNVIPIYRFVGNLLEEMYI